MDGYDGCDGLIDERAEKGEWEHVDATRIAVVGQSCGGLQAYTASLDP